MITTSRMRLLSYFLAAAELALGFGCASQKQSVSNAQEQQFTSMWEEIYARLKPEVDHGHISVERGRLNTDGAEGPGARTTVSVAASAPRPTATLEARSERPIQPEPSRDAGSPQGAAAQEYIRIRLADYVLFDSGTDHIKPEGVEVLTRVGQILHTQADVHILVQGHTDNVPIRERLRARFPDNMALSQARATSAARVLHESGVPSSIVKLNWFGDTKPVSSNETEEGRRKNRRVELLVTPQ